LADDDELRVRPRSIAAMLCTVGLHLAVLGALAPVLPLYVLSLRATTAQWGAIAASNGLVMIFSEPVWGWAADRFGFRRPYALSRLASALEFWLLVLWPGLWAVVVFQALSGLFDTTIGVLSRGYLVRAYGPGRQTYGLSLYLIVYSICLAIGSTVGGCLYEHMGARAVFVAIAALATMGAVVSSVLEEPKMGLPPPLPEHGKAPHVGARGLLAGPLLILGSAGLIQFVANRVVRNFLVLLAQDHAGLDATAVGLLFGAFSLANVVFLMAMNRFDQRVSLTTRIVLGLAMGAVGLAAYSLAHSFAGFLVAVTFDALGWALAAPARVVMVGRFSPPAIYGAALGLHGAWENVGVLLGPVLAGVLWERGGPTVAYQATAVLVAVGAVVALQLRHGQRAAVAERG